MIPSHRNTQTSSSQNDTSSIESSVPHITHSTKHTNLSLGSLNCRSLSKPSNVPTSQLFSRFLRSQSFDILCLQETHANDSDTITRLNLQLQARSSIWTIHCGIISLNPDLHVEPIFITIDQRVILCRVTHATNLIPPFNIMNIYAPSIHKDRHTFYANLLHMPIFQKLLIHLNHQTTYEHTNYSFDFPDIIMGDFNYNFQHFPRDQYTPQHIHSIIIQDYQPLHTSRSPLDLEDHPTPLDIHPPSRHSLSNFIRSQWLWHSLLLHMYNECSHKLSLDPPIPTFRREHTSSTIDYVFVAPHLSPFNYVSNIDYINNTWTDHALLRVNFRFDCSGHGKGLWRANPNLASNPYFIEQLHAALDTYHSQLQQRLTPLSPQLIWDEIKSLTKKVAQTVGRRRAEWRARQLKRLQKKRDKFLHLYRTTSHLHARLPIVEKSINIIQQEMAETQALRAGLRWRENGEKSAGFLKRLIAERTVKTTIPPLQDPLMTHLSSSPNEMKATTNRFYRHLFSPQTVDPASISFFARQIPQEHRIPHSGHDVLRAPFHILDIQEGLQRSPKHSSPGPDGLPYAVLQVMVAHSHTAKIATQVFNDALNHGIFPTSWKETCLVLLPKKGDLSSLANWRPIALINTDAKTFTRLLNQRLMRLLQPCISRHQMGFMPGRFIGEHGMTIQCVQRLAVDTNSQAIALFLDQEKAYDRVHFDYLAAIMKAFNIPDTIIYSIINLYASTNIQININGFLSDSFQQGRGLRQGDPLSPLLFNIAFDPFLRAVHNHPDLAGFNIPSLPFRDATDTLAHTFSHLHISTNTPPPTNHSLDPVKILAYADDTVVLLDQPSSFSLLQQLLSQYASASNASLNYHKTQVLSLSGQPHPQWQTTLISNGISHWHDKNSSSFLTYLGYPIYCTHTQRQQFASTLIQKLRHLCQLHSQRHLSYRGRVTVMNSLIYSTLWHTLRLVPLTRQDLHTIQQIGSSFMNANATATRFSFATLCLPRSKGGLNLIDPASQINALQWRWIQPLLHPHQPNPPSMPSLPLLRHTLNYFLGSSTYPSYHWAFLFPACRPYLPSITAPITNLLRSMDSTHQDYSLCSVPISTCLRLPLMALLLHHPPIHSATTIPFQPPSMAFRPSTTYKFLTGANIFQLHPDHHSLQLRNDFQQIQHPILSRRAVNFITSNRLHLQPFVSFNTNIFVPRTSPSLSFDNDNIDQLTSLLLAAISCSYNLRSASFLISPPSTKGYKLLPIRPNPSSFRSSPLTVSSWKEFWSLDIPLNARNTWYRAIHTKITTRQKLHQFLPTQYSSSCPICHYYLEHTDHFLFTCPLKHEVWSAALAKYISPTFLYCSLQQFKQLLHLKECPDRHNHHLVPGLSSSQVFACIQQSIWSSYYRFVFHAIPFNTSLTLSNIDCSIHTLAAQIELSEADYPSP